MPGHLALYLPYYQLIILISRNKWSKEVINAHAPGFNSSTYWICLLWSRIQLNHALFMIAIEITANSTNTFQPGEKKKERKSESVLTLSILSISCQVSFSFENIDGNKKEKRKNQSQCSSCKSSHLLFNLLSQLFGNEKRHFLVKKK